MRRALQQQKRNTPLTTVGGATTLVQADTCAQQRRHSRDCGVIVCHLIAKILKRHDEKLEDSDSQIYSDVTASNFRRKMVSVFVDPKTLEAKGGRKPRVIVKKK